MGMANIVYFYNIILEDLLCKLEGLSFSDLDLKDKIQQDIMKLQILYNKDNT